MKKIVSADIVICGGGTAGLPAALAAAREGKTVTVVEDDAHIGGAVTDFYVQLRCGNPLHGIYAELYGIMAELNSEMNRINEVTREKNNAFTRASYLMAWYRLFENLPVTFYCNQRIVYSDVDKNTVLAVESQDMRFEGSVFIDATGNGDVAVLSGCEFRMGREAASEFNEIFSPEKPDSQIQQCTLMYQLTRTAEGKQQKDKPPAGNVSFDEDNYLIWGPTVYCSNPTDAGKLSEAHDKALRMMESDSRRWMDKGFYVSGVASKLGVRESRRIVGAYILNYRDVVEQKRHKDSITVANYVIDPWDPDGNPLADEEVKKLCYIPTYEIPYRCMYTSGSNNLLIAGRCVSATHVMHSSLRVMSIVSSIGQAAGTAAALAVQTGCVKSIDTDLLRGKLCAGGMTVSLDSM